MSSLFTHEQLNNIPQLPGYVGNTLGTFNFSLEDVEEKLNHLNIYKYTGINLLRPRVLLALDDMLCGHLNHILNKLAETGIIPADWKSTNITAIHKKGNRQEPGKYRPISLVSHNCVVCKTMKMLIKGKIITQLEDNNLIGDSQHGFRSKRSSLTSLLDLFAHFIDTYEAGNSKAVDLIYLDFQKAFDKVPHERLLI